MVIDDQDPDLLGNPGVAHTMPPDGNGIRARTRKPPSGAAPEANVPCSRRTRCRRLRKPKWVVLLAIRFRTRLDAPLPSSCTVNVIVRALTCKPSTTAPACA